MTRSQLPNAITVARMVMALPLLWLLVTAQYRSALVLALVAGATDVLDGFLAKRNGWQSVLGGIIGRDLVVALGAFAFWRATGDLKPSPTGLSKAATLSQLLLVALVLAHLAGLDLLQRWVQPLMLATAAATVLSGLDYVVSYTLRAWRGRSKP